MFQINDIYNTCSLYEIGNAGLGNAKEVEELKTNIAKEVSTATALTASAKIFTPTSIR